MEEYYRKTSSKCRVNDFKKITKLLVEIYPQDPGSVLLSYINHSRDGKKFFSDYLHVEGNKKCLTITNSMQEELENIKEDTKEHSKQKDIFIKILCESGYTRNETIDALKISLSTGKWRRIKNGILLEPRGNKSLPENLSNHIGKWAETIADDTIIRKTVETVRKKDSYVKETKLAVTCCMKCLWRDFIADNYNSDYSTISYVSFLRRLPKNIIIPRKKTDLCEVCLAAKRVMNKTIRTEEENNLVMIYTNHIQNAQSQRSELKNHIRDLKENEAIIILDFKQNIKLGGSPEEVSRDFYHPTSINYLSFFVKSKDSGFFFDFTSMELSKDAYFVIECFRLLFENENFKSLKIKTLIVWSDVGKHFRNGMVAYFLAHLAETHNMTASYNFFVESHGKNVCDVHFSQVYNNDNITCN